MIPAQNSFSFLSSHSHSIRHEPEAQLACVLGFGDYRRRRDSRRPPPPSAPVSPPDPLRLAPAAAGAPDLRELRPEPSPRLTLRPESLTRTSGCGSPECQTPGPPLPPSLLPSTCVRPAQVALHPAGHGTARTRPRVACPRSTWGVIGRSNRAVPAPF